MIKDKKKPLALSREQVIGEIQKRGLIVSESLITDALVAPNSGLYLDQVLEMRAVESGGGKAESGKQEGEGKSAVRFPTSALEEILGVGADESGSGTGPCSDPAHSPAVSCEPGEPVEYAGINQIPLANAIEGRPITDEWPPRQAEIYFRLSAEEEHMKATLTRLYHGLVATNGRLRGRTEGEPPQPIRSNQDAIRWLLENIG